MGSYVIRVKLLPTDANVESEKIISSVAEKIGSDATIRRKTIEPIAFGLSAVILDLVAPESEGSIEKIEKLVSSAPLVGQYELIGVSRMSSTLPGQSK